MLTNYQNYFMYEPFVRNRDQKFVINIDDINIYSFEDYFEGTINMLKDAPADITIIQDLLRQGIDPEVDMNYLLNQSIYINFRGAIEVPLKVTDLMFNLAFWYALIRTNQSIQPRHIVFDPRYMTRGTIKGFMDRFIIPQSKRKIPIRELNAILDDTSALLRRGDDFSLYLMDTINLEDNIELMKINPEFWETLHADLTDVPIEDYKKAGMDLTNKAIEIIMKSGDVMPYPHCLATAFMSKEGINVKQYKEFAINIGTKPDGNGGVFSVPINTSFINGGVADPMYYFIDSSAGRTAQILSKINVGDSGSFARLLGLNNTDTFLHPDPNYDCDTKNYELVHISSMDVLNRLMGRYYMFYYRGVEHCIKPNDTHLIGKHILLRSPMTCASHARGQGICYKCYGELAYVNNNINIGKMAAEILSSRLTQRLLSAKHLLETIIKKLVWTDAFYNFFAIEGNAIRLQPDIVTKNYSIIIDPDDLDMENKLDFNNDDEENENSMNSELYNEFITKFSIINNKTDEVVEVHTSEFDKMYLSADFNNIIRKKAVNVDDKFVIPMSAIGEEFIFYMIIQNNELSKTMEELMDIINKNARTKSMNKDELLQTFLETTIRGDLYISSVHCEVILSNQLRDTKEVLEKPNWSTPDADYQVFTLNDALNNNASIIISLMYQRLSKVLYNPLSFKKRGASFIDLFFMENPTELLKSGGTVVEGKLGSDDDSHSLRQAFIKADEEME